MVMTMENRRHMWENDESKSLLDLAINSTWDMKSREYRKEKSRDSNHSGIIVQAVYKRSHSGDFIPRI